MWPLNFINAQRLKNQQLSIQLHQVIGLQNLDSESETYRQFKQPIERFNRTYKSHTHSAHGFNHDSGEPVQLLMTWKEMMETGQVPP